MLTPKQTLMTVLLFATAQRATGTLTGTGIVTGAGIDCGADCVETYAAGTTIELIAAPAPCSRAVQWENESGASLTSPLTITSNLTVYAVFAACCPAPVTLLTPADGATNVPIDFSFRWQKAADATSYNMLWGETTPLANPVNTKDAFYFKDSLSPTNTTYYWRVDAVNACGVTPGTVWSLTTEAPFEERPFVITSIEPSLLLLGDSTIVTAHAKDNVGVTSFQFAVNSVDIATSPGSVTYTPSAIGEYSVRGLPARKRTGRSIYNLASQTGTESISFADGQFGG